MRQFSKFRFSKTVAACALAFFSSAAHATITEFSVNEGSVSAVIGLDSTGTSTTAIEIYGGVAGPSCSSAASGTCNNCFTAATGDSGLIPCNERRINPNLVVTFTFKSTTLDGYPTIAYESTTQQVVSQTVTPALISKGNTATVSVKWSDLCSKLVDGGTAPGCLITASGYASGKFLVGISSTQGGTLTTDEAREVTVVAKSIDSTTASLATTSEITQFKMVSGDKKGSITELETGSGSGFPNSSYSGYRWIRLLFEKRATPNAKAWTRINAGSPHTDLEIKILTDGFDVSPQRIEGGDGYDPTTGAGYSVGIDNDQVYDFKVAVVDKARNVGFYTPAANDQICKSTLSNSPTNGPECHTIRPSEVAGILAEKVNCFIATAAFGSPMAKEVSIFRAFRDQFLVPTKLGKDFVRFYYKKGPIAARFIAQNETLRAAARVLLWTPLQIVKVSLNYGLMAGFALFVLLCASPFAIWILVRRRRRAVTDV